MHTDSNRHLKKLFSLTAKLILYLAYLTRYLSTAEGVYIIALNTFQARKKCAFPDLDFCHISRYSPLTKITQKPPKKLTYIIPVAVKAHAGQKVH
jgi:hypothetical protein